MYCETELRNFALFLIVSSEYDLFQLAKLVGSNWRQLGQHLGFNSEHMDCIERDIPVTRERAVKMLHDWYCLYGRRTNLDAVRSKVVELQRSKRSAKEETERTYKHKSYIWTGLCFMFVCRVCFLAKSS